MVCGCVVLQEVQDLRHGPVQRLATAHGKGCVELAWEDVEVSHGTDGGLILLAHRGLRAATLADVTMDAPGEADLVRRVDVDRDVVERQELWVVQGEDTLDNHNGTGMDGGECALDARMGAEIIDRPLNRTTLRELSQMSDEELGLE